MLTVAPARSRLTHPPPAWSLPQQQLQEAVGLANALGDNHCHLKVPHPPTHPPSGSTYLNCTVPFSPTPLT